MAASVGVGLEIGEDHIRVVQLRRTGSGVQVQAVGGARLLAGAMRGGIVQDSRLLAEGVRRVFRENGIVATRAVVALAGRAVTSRILELPKLRRSELRAVVAGEMEHHRMIPPGEGTFDFVPLGEGAADGQARLLLVAADKRIVDAYRDGLRLAGLQLTALEPISLAIYRAVFSSLGAGGVALIAVGAQVTEMGVFQSGSLCYYRQVHAGLLHPVPPIEEPAGTPDQPATTAPIPLVAMPGGSLSMLLFELRRSLDFYHREAGPSARVERVLLSAEIAEAPGLEQEIADGLGLPVSLCDPFEGVLGDPSTGGGIPAGEAGAPYAGAVGAALRAVGAAPEAPALDLSDTGGESRLAKVSLRWLAYALAGSILLVVLATLSWLLIGNALGQGQHSLEAGKRELAQVARLEAERTAAAQRAQQAQATVQLKGVPWSDLLFQVSEFVPRGVWVTNVTSDAASVLALQGEALSADSVALLMESLARSRFFADPRMTSIRLNRASGPDAVTYQMQVTVVPSPAPAGGGEASPPPAPRTRQDPRGLERASGPAAAGGAR